MSKHLVIYSQIQSRPRRARLETHFFGQYQIQTQGREARAVMGIVTQQDNLDPDFTVFENLIVFAHHYRIVGKAAHKRAGELLAQVGLQDYAQNRVDELSGGMQRHLVLARALITIHESYFSMSRQQGLILMHDRTFGGYLVVAACKHNQSGLQTSRFSAQIKALVRF